MKKTTAKKTGSRVRCRARFRVMRDGVIALGPGKIDLLEAIDRAGSISGGGRDMGLSYRRAWDMVATMNACFEHPLVARETGGPGGGGAQLTALGRRIVKLYRAMETKAHSASRREWHAIRKHLLP